MQENIAIEVAARLAESEFSLDELVLRTKELFEKEGMAGLVGLLLSLLDKGLCEKYQRGVKAERAACCCGGRHYEFVDRRTRRLRTSIGKVQTQWSRLRCNKCGKSVIPLRQFLQLKAYQPKSAELEQIVAELVSEQNYRRVSRELNSVGMIPVPKSTAHRWVMESDCDQIDTDRKVVDVLFADGTGYKRRPDETKGKSNRGELRVVVGIRDDGQVIPFGAWTEESWEQIGQEIKNGAMQFEPTAKVLLSDGEGGLAESLADLANGEQQRSHWHLTRDLDIYMWMDQAPKEERRQMTKRMAGLIGIEVPAEDLQKIKPEDQSALEKSTSQAECNLRQLIKQLRKRGYSKAANYVANAADRIFTYIRLWMLSGLICPRASSMIERMMRELGRRLKRIAHGWSERGAAKMARIIIKRISSAHEWQEYWEKRLRISNSVQLSLTAIRVL